MTRSSSQDEVVSKLQERGFEAFTEEQSGEGKRPREQQ